ncbi:MAG: hypothetical protein ACXAC2_23935 [Candidatus Kariarchaeaceae archaeon]|jgi:hypothetical protein
MSANVHFSTILKHFLSLKDVKKQGNSLKYNRKMFAMLSKGNFVVKISGERVNQLRASGEGLPYDPGTGKYMKEWVIIPLENYDKWIDYAQEAKEFVATLAKG